MSRKKTTSHDEKMELVVEFFIEHPEPYQLKELEKAIPKAKPQIKFPVVKEVITALIGDSRIESDKIGLANYYWLFPSAAANKSKRRLESLEKELEESKAKKIKLEEEIAEASVGKEDSEERQSDLQLQKELQQEKEALDKELKKFADNDPELVKKIETDAGIAKDAANRWTDNIYAVQSFTNKKLNMASADFNRAFNIDADMDYVE